MASSGNTACGDTASPSSHCSFTLSKSNDPPAVREKRRRKRKKTPCISLPLPRVSPASKPQSPPPPPLCCNAQHHSRISEQGGNFDSLEQDTHTEIEEEEGGGEGSELDLAKRPWE